MRLIRNACSHRTEESGGGKILLPERIIRICALSDIHRSRSKARWLVGCFVEGTVQGHWQAAGSCAAVFPSPWGVLPPLPGGNHSSAPCPILLPLALI